MANPSRLARRKGKHLEEVREMRGRVVPSGRSPDRRFWVSTDMGHFGFKSFGSALPVRALLCRVSLVLTLLATVLVAACGNEAVSSMASSSGVIVETSEAGSGAVIATPPAAPFPLGVAVEFTDHAASAMVALEKGWFADEGLEITSYENYVTGVDLAAALARGDIQAAYLCLVPTLNVVANAGISIRVVAGTHKYGYGLVVDPGAVYEVGDLGRPEVKIGCTQPGTVVDVLLHRLCDDNGLSSADLESRIQRMNPPAQVLALQGGSIHACFVPEHWATLAEGLGYRMLMTAQDIWPGLEGSVLVVKEDLIRDHPEVVRSLVRVTQRATDWINQNPDEAASVVASSLSATGQEILPEKAAAAAAKLQVTPEVVARSMGRLEYTASLDHDEIQGVIDYVHRLGYLKQEIDAAELLDTSFLED